MENLVVNLMENIYKIFLLDFHYLYFTSDGRKYSEGRGGAAANRG